MVNQKTDREAFEAWAKTQGHANDEESTLEHMMFMHIAWIAWQACAIMSKEPTTGYNVYLDGVHIPDDVVKKAVFLYTTEKLGGLTWRAE